MKNLFVIVAIISLALLSGCQENPVFEPQTSSLQKDKKPEKNRIKICCEVQDPNYRVCNLNGYVDYYFEVTSMTMNPQPGTYEISLTLYMNAVLCDMLGMVHLEWRVEDKSHDIVHVSEEGILILEKSYWITNRTDVVLLVKYLVTTNGVGIASVNLIPLEK